MSLRQQLDPRIGGSVSPELRRQLVESARVTREIQTPPIVHLQKDSNQALTATTAAKITFSTVRWDTHGWWDSTNHRYQPLRAGYYRLTWSLLFAGDPSAASEVRAMLYTTFGLDRAAKGAMAGDNRPASFGGSTVLYADGRDKYWEVWGYSEIGRNIIGNASYTYFCADYLGDNQLR